MTEAIIATIVAAALAGTGGVIVQYFIGRNPDAAPQVEQIVEQNLENVIGDIVENHIQRDSEDSDTEIMIHIHTHHAPREKEDVSDIK